jgi:hypothetical protein
MAVDECVIASGIAVKSNELRPKSANEIEPI